MTTIFGYLKINRNLCDKLAKNIRKSIVTLLDFRNAFTYSIDVIRYEFQNSKAVFNLENHSIVLQWQEVKDKFIFRRRWRCDRHSNSWNAFAGSITSNTNATVFTLLCV